MTEPLHPVAEAACAPVTKQVYWPAILEVYNDASIGYALSCPVINLNQYKGQIATTSLTGRTLYKDGKWNTLCRPFNVIIADSPLKGGHPFIIKWAEGTSITGPVSEDVTINATASTEAIFEGIKFVGSYSPFDITAENKDNILSISSACRTSADCGS